MARGVKMGVSCGWGKSSEGLQVESATATILGHNNRT
jgi:hypothetical protein